MQVNEKRLDFLLRLVEDDNCYCPVIDGAIIDCPNHDSGSDDCPKCWKNFLTEQSPVPTETPAMIRMVSDQLQVDSEVLK